MNVDGSPCRSAPRLAAVGRLVPSVTHDINNPLATLLGRIQLYMVRGSSGMPRGPSGLDDLYEQALMISDKVQTLSSWAREAAGEGPLVPAVLSDHVAEVTQLLGRLLARRGLELHLDIPPSIPPVRVRPLDLKLCVAEALVAICGAVRDPAPLRIDADTCGGQVRLVIRVPGLAASGVPFPPEAVDLADVVTADGLILEVGDAFTLSMPVGSLASSASPPSL